MPILQRLLAAIILIAGCLLAVWFLVVLSFVLWHALWAFFDLMQYGR